MHPLEKGHSETTADEYVCQADFCKVHFGRRQSKSGETDVSVVRRTGRQKGPVSRVKILLDNELSDWDAVFTQSRQQCVSPYSPVVRLHIAKCRS